jgi:hypothetical protein
MKDYDPWEKASESEKAKGFEHAKNISQEVRKFVLKLKSRPGGFWMRKGWDTVYIRSWEFGLLQRWKGICGMWGVWRLMSAVMRMGQRSGKRSCRFRPRVSGY